MNGLRPTHTAHNKAFRISDTKGWGKVLLNLLSDCVDDRVLREIKKENPRCILDGDFVWLNQTIMKVNGVNPGDVAELLSNRLPRHFSGAIAFHGCRPESLESYKTKGLLPSDTRKIRERAITLFGEESVDAAIADIGHSYQGHNRGVIWLCISRSAFLKPSQNNYLIHGSEFLSAIANRLGRSDLLRQRGTPTIIECFIPNYQLPHEFWKSIARSMLERWFCRFLKKSLPTGDTCFKLSSPIPPENILKFHFFHEVVRPFTWADPLTQEIHFSKEILLRPIP